MAGRGATETWAEPLGRGGDKKALRRRYLPPHQSCTMSRILLMYLAKQAHKDLCHPSPNDSLTQSQRCLSILLYLSSQKVTINRKKYFWWGEIQFPRFTRVLFFYFCTFCCIPRLCISPTTPPHLKGPLTHSITLALKTYSLFSFEQLVPSCSFGFLWSWFDLYVSSSVISIESKIILCFWWGRDTAML